MAETLLPSAQAAWSLSSPPWTPCSGKGDPSAEDTTKAPQEEFGVNRSQSKGDGQTPQAQEAFRTQGAVCRAEPEPLTPSVLLLTAQVQPEPCTGWVQVLTAGSRDAPYPKKGSSGKAPPPCPGGARAHDFRQTGALHCSTCPD